MKELLKSICYMTSHERRRKLIQILTEKEIPFDLYGSNDNMNLILFPKNLNHEHIVYTAHYDIVRGSCGANDNGSSVTILLKLAEYLKNTDNENIVIAFLDREETGGCGCELHFTLPEVIENCRLMVNLDVCGCGDRAFFVDETAHNNFYAKTILNSDLNCASETDNFPYCDGRHAERMGYDVIGISVFPENDAIKLDAFRFPEAEKEIVRVHGTTKDPSLIHKTPSLPEIYAYMHNGSKDDICYINFNLMSDICEWLKNASSIIIKKGD